MMLFQRKTCFIEVEHKMRDEGREGPQIENIGLTKSIKGEVRFYPDGNQQSPTFGRGLGQDQIFVLWRSTWAREKKRLRENEAKF